MNKLEREAFIKAYLRIVACAPRHYVEEFLTKLEAGVEPECDENYSNVADALGMWHAALIFAGVEE
jgi:hypothetical protein